MSDKLGPIDIEFVLDKKAEENAKSLREALDSIAKSGTGGLKTVEQAMKELIETEKELLEVEKKLETVGPGAEKDAMLEFIRVSKETINQEKSDLQELQKEMGDTVDGTDKMTGALSKWLLTLGGATAALGVLKKEFLETTAGMNLFATVGAGIKQLLRDIVGTGAVNINNIGEAVRIQKELNVLRVQEYKENLDIAEYNLQYQKLYSDSLDATLSRSEKIKAINDALAAHNKAIDLQVKNTKEHIKSTSELLAMNPGNEKLLKELYDLNIELKTLEAERFQSTKRLTSSLSQLLKEEADEIKEFRKNIHDNLQKILDENLEMEKKLRGELSVVGLKGKDKELAELKRRYQEDLEAWSANENIKNLLTEKYLIERSQIIKKYEDDELARLKRSNEKILQEIMKLNPGRGYAILERAIKNWTNVTGPGVNQLKPTNQSADKIQKQADENLNKEVDKQLRLRQEIAGAAKDLLSTLGQIPGMDSQASGFLQGLSSAVQEALDGDYIGLISTALTTIFSIIPNRAEEFNRQLNRMNALIEEQDRLLQQSYREGGTDEAWNQKISSLEKKKKLIQDTLGDQNVKLLERFGRDIIPFLVSLPGITQQMVDSWFDINEQLDDAKQAQKDFLAGDVIQNDIADAVANGFLEGGTAGIDSVAEYMNDVLKQAAINIFKNEILGSSLTGWVDQMRLYLDDKKLTQAERDSLMEAAKQMAEDWQPLWDDLMKAFPGEDVSEKSLTGAIKGVSEQTASVIAGQMNAVRINQVQGIDLVRRQMMHLEEIASNTRYNKHLESIDRKLDVLQSDNSRAIGIL